MYIAICIKTQIQKASPGGCDLAENTYSIRRAYLALILKSSMLFLIDYPLINFLIFLVILITKMLNLLT